MKRPLLLLLGCGLHAQEGKPPLADLLGVPYVVDAVEDEAGHWVTFAHPDRVQPARGFNCSGFVVTASRRLLGFSGSLAEASRDRLGDSGPQAPFGQDWDFGWDLVLNLSEGLDRHWLLPDGPHPVEGDGRQARGFRVQEDAAWARLLPRLRGDRVYLAVFNRAPGGHLKHHHVGLLLKDSAGRAWFYQTLPKGRSHRVRLDGPEGMVALKRMFGPGERVLLLEVTPPEPAIRH